MNVNWLVLRMKISLYYARKLIYSNHIQSHIIYILKVRRLLKMILLVSDQKTAFSSKIYNFFYQAINKIEFSWNSITFRSLFIDQKANLFFFFLQLFGSTLSCCCYEFNLLQWIMHVSKWMEEERRTKNKKYSKQMN